MSSGSGLRYRCLLLDHDDTTVKSTAEIHHPAHVDSVRELRPDLEPVSLHGWFEKNHEPGVSNYLKSIFSEPGQMDLEHNIWRKWIDATIPHFYEGVPELLAEFRARGGLVAVISHSPADVIWRHYKAHPMSDKISPDLVFGWDDEPSNRKPSPWPAQQALERLGVDPADVLVLDDLSPGVKMARSAGLAVAAAGWGHSVPVIEEYMTRECDHVFPTVSSFAEFLLQATPIYYSPSDKSRPMPSVTPEDVASAVPMTAEELQEYMPLGVPAGFAPKIVRSNGHSSPSTKASNNFPRCERFVPTAAIVRTAAKKRGCC